MKKIILLVFCVALISVSAKASKARLESLGESANGSYYIDDTRNVFLNPAYLNFHKDFITFELGGNHNEIDSSSGSNETINSVTYHKGPIAEGGIFKTNGSLIFGAYVGAHSTLSNNLRKAANINTAAFESDTLNLFIAGDLGRLWGLNLVYHSYLDETGTNKVESKVTRLKFGIVQGDLETFGAIEISNTADDGTYEMNVKSHYNVGAVYHRAGLDYFGELRLMEAEDETEESFKSNEFTIGMAKTYKLNDNATIWLSSKYTNANYTCDWAAGCGYISAGTGDTKASLLPVTMSLEYMAKEWLVFRAAVSQYIYGQVTNDDNKAQSTGNTTGVTTGASIVWGDFQIDGIIGSDANGGGLAGDYEGVIRTDALFSRASMTYKF